MLLRVGLTMMGVALAIAVGVALALISHNEEPVSATVGAQGREQTVTEPALERRAVTARPSPERPSPERPPPERPSPERSPLAQSSPERPSPRQPSGSPESSAEGPEVLPIADSGWPKPSNAEAKGADGPRYFPPRQDSVLTLTVDSLGLYDVPVLDSGSEAALEQGVVHIPQTPMPWEEREQKNVYLAGHRLGYPGTGSRLIFYNLDKLQGGDVISMRDRSGVVYKYRVTEMFEVDPSDDWVMDTVLGRDIVTLQTCAPIPTYEKRLIVRADRMEASASFG